MNRESLLVFSDDWGRHPSSCQHLVRRLLPEHRTLWVNTIGMRAPRLDWATVTRGWEKIRGWTGLSPAQHDDGPRDAPANLTVLSPRMWPWFRTRFDRWLNRRLLAGALRRAVEEQPTVAVTTIPVVADLIGALPVERWVYYCVDDFSVWPGLDHGPIALMEERLIAKADEIVVVSETLRDRVRSFGRDAHLLTHGVDLDMWRDGSESPAFLDDIPRPLIVFWGVIDQRMDAQFVAATSEAIGDGTIVLIGPQQEPPGQLSQLPNVRFLPPTPLETLPAVAAAASVLIMPYIDAPVTRAMQPLKLKEYLATPRPVVVRSLPVTESWSDCLDVASDPITFAQQVALRARTGLPDAHARGRARLSSESWSEKAKQLKRFLTPEEEALS